MLLQSKDSFQTKEKIQVGAKEFIVFNQKKISHPNLNKLPISLRIILENLLRHEDGLHVTKDDIEDLLSLSPSSKKREISFYPARVLMQDFTGVPAVVDLAVMRDALKKMGGDPAKINPMVPVDLVVDHSVNVDFFGTPSALNENVKLEFQRNADRYAFLKWGQQAFQKFRVVPPGQGICHQINLEYLGQTISHAQGRHGVYAYPDTVIGTDSHTTMINGLSILGWGVGGIEAEAVMLGQPISLLIPDVLGFYIEGQIGEGVTSTDLVLTITQMLRQRGVVGKFVEFFGPGLTHLSMADRATIANMAPEYGATCGFFPIDEETVKYLKFTGRDSEGSNLVQIYAKTTGLWRDDKFSAYDFSDVLELHLSEIVPSVAGPKYPQQRVLLENVKSDFHNHLVESYKAKILFETAVSPRTPKIEHGHVVIAAITSCTNTSNPAVMLGAGCLAKKAVERGLKVKPWVKTSLAPGSQVVSDYLEKSGLQKYLDHLGFHTVGYGCTTCIGNSGPLTESIMSEIEKENLVVAAVLSGNRNFEGRINSHVKANYLGSPMLVVAYALAGSLNVNLKTDSLGLDSKGQEVFLKDLWPTRSEIQDLVDKSVESKMFHQRYNHIFEGTESWQNIVMGPSQTYAWQENSYIKKPPYFESMTLQPPPLTKVQKARILAVWGDSITTDHISPAGSIKKDSPAGKYLLSQGIQIKDFNSYGARRGNHEVMVRGTFANIRLRNEMLENVEGGFTTHFPSNEMMSIYEAAIKYQETGTSTVIFAGKEYGTGSSRDWAAKGTRLLGVRVVIAESFERIHRSNLIGMGVLPLQFLEGTNRKILKIIGNEYCEFDNLENIKPQGLLNLRLTRSDGSEENIKLLCRIDTKVEFEYFKNGGILPFVLRKMI